MLHVLRMRVHPVLSTYNKPTKYSPLPAFHVIKAPVQTYIDPNPTLILPDGHAKCLESYSSVSCTDSRLVDTRNYQLQEAHDSDLGSPPSGKR